MRKYRFPGKLREVMFERIESDKAMKKNITSFVKFIQKEAISSPTYAPQKAVDSEKTSLSLQNEFEEPNNCIKTSSIYLTVSSPG